MGMTGTWARTSSVSGIRSSGTGEQWLSTRSCVVAEFEGERWESASGRPCPMRVSTPTWELHTHLEVVTDRFSSVRSKHTRNKQTVDNPYRSSASRTATGGTGQSGVRSLSFLQDHDLPEPSGTGRGPRFTPGSGAASRRATFEMDAPLRQDGRVPPCSRHLRLAPCARVGYVGNFQRYRCGSAARWGCSRWESEVTGDVR